MRVKVKVLIVEDNTTIAEGLRRLLENDGYTVMICGSIRNARKYIESDNYNLIILDIVLPDGDGRTLAEEIKEKPIIFLTAKDAEEDIIRSFEIGGDDYIVKPFRIGELKARIQNVLRKYNSQNSIIKIGNLTIDFEKRKIFKEEKDIEFTVLEWKILSILLNANGKIVTRERLLNISYNANGNFINDNSLSVYIKRIRKKIEDDANNPQIIKTVKGVGYRIEYENN